MTADTNGEKKSFVGFSLKSVTPPEHQADVQAQTEGEEVIILLGPTDTGNAYQQREKIRMGGVWAEIATEAESVEDAAQKVQKKLKKRKYLRQHHG